MEKRVTIRDIAAKTGLHYSTVSLALRGDTRIQSATRETVRLAAEELGYQRDPMIQALAVYRTSIRPAGYQGTIAWLTNDTSSQMRPGHGFWNYAEGARDAAAEMGYQIEEFLFRNGPGAQRFVRTLLSRNIRGILVPPQRTSRIRTRIRLDWTHFSAIAFGHTLGWPPIHRISNNQYRAARQAIRRLRSLGYRRIGLFVSWRGNARVDEAWFAGYITEMQRHAPIPEAFFYNALEPEALRDWIRRYELEAILTDTPNTAFRVIEHAGLPVPEALGVASLRLQANDTYLSGMDQNEHLLGKIAVSQLVSMMQRQERGIPEVPQRLLVEGIWKPGQTVRRITRPITSPP